MSSPGLNFVPEQNPQSPAGSCQRHLGVTAGAAPPGAVLPTWWRNPSFVLRVES